MISTRAFDEVRRERLRMALQFGKQGIMQFRVLFTVVVLVFACGSAVAEPKAYELVKYKGKAEGVTIALDYADGYQEASRMWVTDRKGKTTRFMLDESGDMRFVPKKSETGKREVVLKMGDDDGPNIEATYTVDGKAIKFTLRPIE